MIDYNTYADWVCYDFNKLCRLLDEMTGLSFSRAVNDYFAAGNGNWVEADPGQSIASIMTGEDVVALMLEIAFVQINRPERLQWFGNREGLREILPLGLDSMRTRVLVPGRVIATN